MVSERLGYVPAPLASARATRPALTIEDFIAERGPKLLRFAYLVTGSHADAEDLLQEVLTDCHRKWLRVAVSDHPYAYVRAMMVNRHTSAKRRKWNGEKPTDPDDIRVESVAAIDPTLDVDVHDELWRLLGTLPPRMRAVLVLRYFDDADDVAIAEALGIAVSTVRATASRGLTQLRLRVGQEP